MVTIVKHEWHQVDSQFAIDFTKDILEEIYPDMDEDELDKLWQELEAGDADIDSIIQDAWDNDVELEWENQYDDWWTHRKGGYDITYEYGDESSWTKPEVPPEPTHKCTKCKWTGQSYDADWSWEDKDGNELEDPRKVCPYCESDTELTEYGKQEEKEKEERYSKIKEDLDNITLDDTITEDEIENEYEELIQSQQVVEEKEIEYDVKDNYPAGNYKIELRGRTLDAGVGKITEAQYLYWKDREDELGEALNDSFDYEENETPDECKLYEYYNEYDDVKFVWGVESDCWIIISTENNTIFEGSIYKFLEKVHGDNDSYYDAVSSTEEFYSDYDLKDKGPVVFWQQYGKGGWYDGLLEGEFDPKKLRFESIDFEGTEYITKVIYGDDEISNEGGDYWGKYSDYKVYNI